MEAKPIHHIIKYKTKEQHDQIYYEYFYTFEPYEVKRSQYFYYQPIFFYTLMFNSSVNKSNVKLHSYKLNLNILERL